MPTRHVFAAAIAATSIVVVSLTGCGVENMFEPRSCPEDDIANVPQCTNGTVRLGFNTTVDGGQTAFTAEAATLTVDVCHNTLCGSGSARFEPREIAEGERYAELGEVTVDVRLTDGTHVKANYRTSQEEPETKFSKPDNKKAFVTAAMDYDENLHREGDSYKVKATIGDTVLREFIGALRYETHAGEETTCGTSCGYAVVE